jgi:hypothetical protein
MGAVAARVHNALRNALVIEVKDLFAEVEILNQRWPAWADLQRILVVRNRAALSRGQDRHVAGRNLMELAAFTTGEFLIVNGCYTAR